MKKVFIVMVGFLMIGCLSNSKSRAKKMDEGMNSWKGKTINQLI